MFAAFLAAGLSAAQPPAPVPAPLPDRWLLQLVPADLPRAAPPRLYAETWFDAHHSRAIHLSWERWIQFRPGYLGGPATASITKLGEGERVVPNKRDEPVHRVVPLAVHGPLVEFDGKLFTAVVAPVRVGMKAGATQQLHLGAAVALKDNVWYQVGTRPSADGKTVTVEEWRLEFRDDPRTTDEGTATVRGHTRVLTEQTGEATKLELRFKRTPPREPDTTRIIDFVQADSTKRVRLPTLILGRGDDGADAIWDTSPAAHLDRLTLTPATRLPPVRLVPGMPELVQPPPKEKKKVVRPVLWWSDLGRVSDGGGGVIPARTEVAADADGFAKLWKTHKLPGVPPRVNFREYVVVSAFRVSGVDFSVSGGLAVDAKGNAAVVGTPAFIIATNAGQYSTTIGVFPRAGLERVEGQAVPPPGPERPPPPRF